MTKSLEDPARASELKALVARKASLRDWYRQVYARWTQALSEVRPGGIVAEIGSGAGFAREIIPGLVATDTLPYQGLDAVVDAGKLPWDAGSVRALFMLNVLHHLPDAPRFFAEAERVLKPGGLLMMTDQHVGRLSRYLLRWGHHEPFDPKAVDWRAPVEHPLSGANGALAWIIFKRDRPEFERQFPNLRLAGYEPFSPLQYWLSGGLQSWNLLPASLLGLLKSCESALMRLSPEFGSFAHITVRRL